MARKLFNIDTGEISLVDRAANKKKFLIKKQERKIMKDFIEKLKKFFGEDKPLTDEEIVKIEKLDPEKGKTLGEALDIFQSYQEDFADDLLEATHVILKGLIPEDQEPEEIDTEGLVTLLTEKAGASLSKATKAQLEKIKTIIESMLKVKTEKIAGDNKDLPDDVLARLEKLEGMEADEEERLETEKTNKEQKLTDTIDEMQKKLEKLEGKKRGVSNQVKEGDDEGDEGDPEVKKKDKKFQWDSLNPK